MNRRQLLIGLVLGLLSPDLTRCGQSRRDADADVDTDVIVVGAGIAGLAAAKTLVNLGFQVMVLEGRSRLGGRIWTDRSLGIPIDMGASWIHGSEGNPITTLAAQVAAQTVVTHDDSVVVYDSQGNAIPDDSIQHYEQKYTRLLADIDALASNLPEDISVAEAIRRLHPSYLSDPLMQYPLTAYMEFDAGGSIEHLSSQYWADDRRFPGRDVLFMDGYHSIITLLAQQLPIEMNQQVTAIAYDNQRVTVTTTTGVFSGHCAVVTLPLGVLKQQQVQFTPPLPTAMTRAIDRLGMGTVNKVVLRFPQAFWDINTQYIGFTSPTKGMYPYFLNFRTFSPANVLMTFGLGNYGLALESQSDGQITADVMATLKTLFGNRIPQPNGVLISRWAADPFSSGAYSYAAVGSTSADFDILSQPVDNRLFFAGEHTIARYRSTTHGAYLSGIRAAETIGRLYAE